MNNCIGTSNSKEHLTSSQAKLLNRMRNNLRELNRSMQSIQSMLIHSHCVPTIKRKELTASSKDQGIIRTEYTEEGVQQDRVVGDSNIPSLFGSLAKEKAQNLGFSRSIKAVSRNLFNSTPSRSISTIRDQIRRQSSKKLQVNPCLNKKHNIPHHPQKQTSSYSVVKESHPQQMHLSRTEHGQQVYHFSPQKTKKQSTNSTFTMFNPENKSSLKLRLTHKQNNSADLSHQDFKPYKIKLELPTDTDVVDFKIQRKQCKQTTRYKTEQDRMYTQQAELKQNPLEMPFKLKQPTIYPTKKKICLKTGDESNTLKKAILNKIQKQMHPSQILTKQSIHSKAQANKLKEFLVKIKRYGFVEKYLTQSQITSIYSQLKQSNLPEDRWPIAIVDQVYKKIKPFHN